MGKSLIKEAIAYLGTVDGERYELVARAGFDHLKLSESVDRRKP